MALKRGDGKRGEWVGKQYSGCWALWPLCVFGFISVVVMHGVYVRDYRGLVLFTVGTVA
jgi:hypothetical protein